jgi:hypothetical protein
MEHYSQIQCTCNIGFLRRKLWFFTSYRLLGSCILWYLVTMVSFWTSGVFMYYLRYSVRFHFHPSSDQPWYDTVENRAQHSEPHSNLDSCTFFHDVDPFCNTQHDTVSTWILLWSCSNNVGRVVRCIYPCWWCSLQGSAQSPHFSSVVLENQVLYKFQLKLNLGNTASIFLVQ